LKFSIGDKGERLEACWSTAILMAWVQAGLNELRRGRRIRLRAHRFLEKEDEDQTRFGIQAGAAYINGAAMYMKGYRPCPEDARTEGPRQLEIYKNPI
jgi:hypothetical protein